MPPAGRDYLVAYDVSSPKRWRRVYRLLHGYGDWVQLSVFRCRLDPRRRRRMEQELRAVMETAEDRLLIARLEEDGPTGRTSEAGSTGLDRVTAKRSPACRRPRRPAVLPNYRMWHRVAAKQASLTERPSLRGVLLILPDSARVAQKRYRQGRYDRHPE